MEHRRKKKYKKNPWITVSCILICCAILLCCGMFLYSQRRQDNVGITHSSEKIINTEQKDLSSDDTENDMVSVGTHNNLAKYESTTDFFNTEISSEIEVFNPIDTEIRRIQSINAGELANAGMLASEIADKLFFGKEIDDTILTRITGKSYTENENIFPKDLVYLRMLYYGADGNTYVGEMIVNKKIEDKVLRIFKTLYENQYPIEQMVLVDEYNAEDEASMYANNTSAFNYRTIAGSDTLSNHSYGMAIDLNPKYNPYVKIRSDGSVFCQPESSMEYTDRAKDFPYKIDENDLAYQLFTEEGFTWGGSWNSVKDYQHFEWCD